jgi:cytochrome c553
MPDCTPSRYVLAGALALLSAAAWATPTVIEACKACHGEDGAGVGKRIVPIIAAIPAVHIEEALYAYQDDARMCVTEPAMCETVKLLSDDDIAALAEHYSTLPRQSLDVAFDASLAARGKNVHERHCRLCHVKPDDPGVADALGIPLHGQRPDYLRYALQAYIDGTREHMLEQMKVKIDLLEDGDVEALVNYYASY